jgi:surface protein
MGAMFMLATSFNSDLGNWDVSRVIDMANLFNTARSFNSDISKWDVSSVTKMEVMFSHAKSFSADLSTWDVSSVVDVKYMFDGATSYNSNLCRWGENKLLYGDAATGIFVGSGCAYQDEPQEDTRGPFCGSSCLMQSTASEMGTTTPDNPRPSESPVPEVRSQASPSSNISIWYVSAVIVISGTAGGIIIIVGIRMLLANARRTNGTRVMIGRRHLSSSKLEISNMYPSNLALCSDSEDEFGFFEEDDDDFKGGWAFYGRSSRFI